MQRSKQSNSCKLRRACIQGKLSPPDSRAARPVPFKANPREFAELLLRPSGRLVLMRNRNNTRLVLVGLLLAAILAVWLFRAQSPLNHTTGPAKPSEARSGPRDIYPDPLRTPGATNPDITQNNVRETICNPNWSTKSIRPPARYTNRLKAEQIRQYRYADSSLRDFEEDHFIPLELGGNPTDPSNLWPEPFDTSIADGGARSKDKVENYLHAEVCAGKLTLEQAQKEITEDWYRVYTTRVPH
jgi:hypothetical protein